METEEKTEEKKITRRRSMQLPRLKNQLSGNLTLKKTNAKYKIL